MKNKMQVSCKNFMNEQIIISSAEEGKRIDVVCAQRFPDFSRTKWAAFGKFLLDKKEKAGKTKVQVSEAWHISYEGEMASSFLRDIEAWDLDLPILAESESWVVINKPEGVSVHPSQTEHTSHTIINALVHHFGTNLSENTSDIGGQKISRPGLVHRLDKGTSGVLLVAKTNATHRYFQEHWKEVEKTYYALVQGVPPVRGRVESGIERDTQNRQKMTVGDSDHAKDATTLFERVRTNSGFSLLKITIPTGRTHQIRVHLSEIGFPIVGDGKYGGSKSDRIMLHAAELSFPDPDKKGKQRKVSSPVPGDFISW